MQYTYPLDIHQAVAMGGGLGLQQLGEASALSRVGGECLDRPDVGDDIDQRAANFGGTVGIAAVARGAAPAEQGKGADRQQHEQSERDYKMPVDGRQNRQRRTKIGADGSDVE